MPKTSVPAEIEHITEGIEELSITGSPEGKPRKLVKNKKNKKKKKKKTQLDMPETTKKEGQGCSEDKVSSYLIPKLNFEEQLFGDSHKWHVGFQRPSETTNSCKKHTEASPFLPSADSADKSRETETNPTSTSKDRAIEGQIESIATASKAGPNPSAPPDDPVYEIVHKNDLDANALSTDDKGTLQDYNIVDRSVPQERNGGKNSWWQGWTSKGKGKKQ